MMWQYGAGWGWWMAFGWIWMIVFWGLIIWGVYTLVSKLSGSRGESTPPRETAMDILQRRYASGELTREQFDEMREHLSGPKAGQTA
jgi:putative membrane protein